MKDKNEVGFSSVDNTYRVSPTTVYKLTDVGIHNIGFYIEELKAKRKEILEAGKDTADDTTIPTFIDIFMDCVQEGFDEDGESYNSWGVTDHYDADYPILLKIGRDVELIDSLIFDDKEVEQIKVALTKFAAIANQMGYNISSTGLTLTSDRQVVEVHYVGECGKLCQYYSRTIKEEWIDLLNNIKADLFNALVGISNKGEK